MKSAFYPISCYIIAKCCKSEFNATLMKRISKAVVTPKINAIILHEISHKVTIYDFDIIYAF